MFTVDCLLKPITVQVLTRYCDALPKTKVRNWGFWGGAVGFCWRTICVTRCPFLGSPICIHKTGALKCWYNSNSAVCIKCLCTLSNCYCATSSLDMLTSQHNARLWAPAVEEVVEDVWQATIAADVIFKKIAVDYQGIKWCYVPYTGSTCLMRVFGLTSLSNWLDRLAWLDWTGLDLWSAVQNLSQRLHPWRPKGPNLCPNLLRNCHCAYVCAGEFVHASIIVVTLPNCACESGKVLSTHDGISILTCLRHVTLVQR